MKPLLQAGTAEATQLYAYVRRQTDMADNLHIHCTSVHCVIYTSISELVILKHLLQKFRLHLESCTHQLNICEHVNQDPAHQTFDLINQHQPGLFTKEDDRAASLVPGLVPSSATV